MTYDLPLAAASRSAARPPGNANHPQGRRVTELMLGHIVALFDASGGCLALRLDNRRPDLTIVACQGDSGYRPGEAVASDDPLLGPAAAVGPHDVSGGSALSWPLLAGEQAIGAVCLRRASAAAPFSSQDLQRGVASAAFLAGVIESVRLRDEARRRLEDTRRQLLQSEKMASIGQLAAGVAHEINNPIGYVHSNLGSLDNYVGDLFRILDVYAVAVRQAAATPGRLEEIEALRRQLDIDFLREDVRALLAETREGIGRVRQIVQDLKDISRAGAKDEWQQADLHKGLESTLNIVASEIKYKAQVIKEYGCLPEIECLPGQLNQVFMNLLVNAAHAIREQGVIAIRTGADAASLWVEIADTGCGIPPELLPRIFEPFFTTKPAGQGTGLGLSLSESIVRKHGGRIEVESEVGRGTTFRVILPRQRAAQGTGRPNEGESE